MTRRKTQNSTFKYALRRGVGFQHQLFYDSVKGFALVFSKLNGLGLIFFSRMKEDKIEELIKQHQALRTEQNTMQFFFFFPNI